ncbi:MAG TPA: sigma-70 family RNA polymerase sigma factor, partial [Actinospica sp.]|nr:sigma-70 family RNA polymerase sigma factor [Actinospica sp.]
MNADTSGGGHAVSGAVLGGTAGDGWGRAAAYDAYADGLHTYALWYLRDHDAASDAVYCAFVAADRNHTNLQQPEQIQPWLYALLRHECRMRAAEQDAPSPVSTRLRPKPDALGESGVAASLMQLEDNLRRAEFQSLAWPEAEGLAPAHREVLELTIRHGLDSRGLALVLGLREGAAGLAPSRGFGLLADAWRELERSLAAAAVAASGRENCAQLAELTFGWSGKLNVTLRAPLTDHVDRCSRCQHYLHTVIGTPSAPTILPYVAAPRALRELVLGELADFDVAADAGVDLLALGARCGAFGPEGFPARFDLTRQGAPAGAANVVNAPAGAGRGPRRRNMSGAGRPGRPQRATPVAVARPQPVHKVSAVEQDVSGSPVSAAPTAAAGLPPRSRMSEADELFRARGSWADRVLPPEYSAAATASSSAAASASPAVTGHAAGTTAAGGLWRPEPEPGFVQTPSGRFATRLPERPRPSAPGRHGAMRETDAAMDATDTTNAMNASSTTAAASAGVTSPAGDTRETLYPLQGSRGAQATHTAVQGPRLPLYPRTGRPMSRTAGSASRASSAPSSPTSPASRVSDASPAAPGARPRHRARPMRQAVVSAMALGAVGAVAAAAAAMLGAVSHTHSNATALDGTQSGESLGTASGTALPTAPGGGLTVSVTTAGPQSGLLTGSSGLGVGLVPNGGSAGTSSVPTTASSGSFYVSVNQRAADPDSVQILLRNAGTAPLHWAAAPSVAWLTLSQ